MMAAMMAAMTPATNVPVATTPGNHAVKAVEREISAPSAPPRPASPMR